MGSLALKLTQICQLLANSLVIGGLPRIRVLAWFFQVKIFRWDCNGSERNVDELDSADGKEKEENNGG